VCSHEIPTGSCWVQPFSVTIPLNGSRDTPGVHETISGSVSVTFIGCDGKARVKILDVETPSKDGKTPTSDKSFVSTDEITFHASMAVACQSSNAGNALFDWTSNNTPANGSLTPKSVSNQQYVAKPSPPAAPSARNDPLTYVVTAKFGGTQDQFTLTQDAIDKIRQQYIDMSKSTVPPRDKFIDSGQSPGGHFTFANIQSRDGAPWAVFSAFDHLEAWRTNYRAALTINRGYSTPKYNATIVDPGNGKPAARESQHIYGTAADVASTQANWDELAQSAWAAGACVEPIKSHVHADWRGTCPWGY